MSAPAKPWRLERRGAVNLSSSGLPIVLTIGSSNNLSSSLSGSIGGNGGLVVNGDGGVTLSGSNTYSGPTTINAGTLYVANPSGSATGTNSVAVSSGGTLAGSSSPGQGFLSGAVSINSGGAIAADNGAKLTLSGGLTLAAGSTASTFNLSGPIGPNPLVTTSGGAAGNSLVVNGTNVVTAIGTPTVGTYDLIGFAGGAPPVGSFSMAAVPPGMSYMVNIASNQVDLEVGSIDQTGADSFGGTVLSASVANHGNYGGLASLTGAAISGPPTTGIEGTTATILAGANNQGHSVSLSMTWRGRTTSELPASGIGGGNASPDTTPIGSSAGPLISDVVDLFGMATGSTGATNAPPVQTDPFVLQVSFDPSTLKAQGFTDANLATRGNLYLASLVSGRWENTIDANLPIAGATTAKTLNGMTINVGNSIASDNFALPFIGTFAQWESSNPLFNSTNIVDYLGAWGVDPNSLSNGEYNSWAIIDHNSEFAVAAVPEPSSLLLAGIGVVGLLIVATKRRAGASYCFGGFASRTGAAMGQPAASALASRSAGSVLNGLNASHIVCSGRMLPTSSADLGQKTRTRAAR